MTPPTIPVSISSKIVLLLGLMVALSAAIAGFAAGNISALARSERALVDGDGASLRWVASAQEHMTRSHQLVFQINDAGFSASGVLRGRLLQEEAALNSDMERFHAVMSPDERSLYGAIQARSERYAAFAANDIRLLQTAGHAPAQALLFSSGVQAFDQADAAFDQMVGKQSRDMDADASVAARQAGRALLLILLVSILGAAGVGALALTIARRQISGPLTRITAAMARLAAGEDVDALATTDRRDEIGDLARVFTIFRQNAIALLATTKDAKEQRRLVETERLSGGFFRSAIESSMDSVRVLDLEGRLKFMNCGSFVAFEIDDFAPFDGRACQSLWPEPGATQIGIGIDAARRGETHRFEGACPTTSGVEKWWDVFIAPVRDDAGALTAIIATSRDITMAHQLRAEAEVTALELARSAAALRSAFRIAHVGGWEVDFVAGRTLFSPELCELLDLPPAPAMTFAEANAFWCDEDRGRFEDLLARVEAHGERLVFEGRNAGTGRSWRLFGEPVFDGDRCVALRGAGQDISDWRDAMERERAALQAAEAMSGFLATMSHEIRTPLNGILGMAQAMGLGDLSKVQRGRLEVIQTSGGALLSLLNDLLDLSRIQAGRLELEVGEVDARELIAGARKVFTPLVRGKDVRLDLHVAPSGRGRWVGDPDRVRQVLHNLIANAVKFTERGSIDIVLDHTGHDLVLRVQDTGIGIPAARLPHIFDRFVQVDASTTRRFGGSGLGLAICRDLVDLMKGTLHVESIEGEGTTFEVRLPLERAKPAAVVALVAELVIEPPEIGLRVLVAEDNEVNQLVLKTLLSAVGIEPSVVSNGREALEAWRAGDWDVVLMDIQMPVMDGIGAARLMRECERSEGRPHTPIIAVTANAMTHHEAEYRAAGMDSMVAKPVDLKTLMHAIQLAIELPQAA